MPVGEPPWRSRSICRRSELGQLAGILRLELRQLAFELGDALAHAIRLGGEELGVARRVVATVLTVGFEKRVREPRCALVRALRIAVVIGDGERGHDLTL